MLESMVEMNDDDFDFRSANIAAEGPEAVGNASFARSPVQNSFGWSSGF